MNVTTGETTGETTADTSDDVCVFRDCPRDDDMAHLDLTRDGPATLCRYHYTEVKMWALFSPDAPLRNPLPPDLIPPRRTTTNHQPIVYFLRMGDTVKIGTTTNLPQRLQRLALPTTSCVLALDGDAKLERSMHLLFAAERIDPRREWFRWSPEVEQFIADRVHMNVAAEVLAA